MTHPVTGIDHAFLLANDLDDAARRYAALGVTPSPRGLHSAAKGSANHTITFPRDCFELLGIITPTEGVPRGARRPRRWGRGCTPSPAGSPTPKRLSRPWKPCVSKPGSAPVA